MKITLNECEKKMAANGGSLYLSGTGITALPDNLTVGGSLDLSGTGITALPDNLTVGGSLYLSGTGITGGTKCRSLHNGEYVPDRYLYADDVLTHVKAKKTVGEYTLYVGKIKGRNVVYDGTNYAHCNSLREGIADLNFKKAADRGANQFKHLTLDDSMAREEAMAMYRIITGACKQGTESFVANLKDPKESYTVREMIEITKGQYNSEKFREFFEG